MTASVLPGAGAEGQACPCLWARQECPLESRVTPWARDSSRGTETTLRARENIHPSARLLSVCHVPGTVPGSKDGALRKTDERPALFSAVGGRGQTEEPGGSTQEGVACPRGQHWSRAWQGLAEKRWVVPSHGGGLRRRGPARGLGGAGMSLRPPLGPGTFRHFPLGLGISGR